MSDGKTYNLEDVEGVLDEMEKMGVTVVKERTVKSYKVIWCKIDPVYSGNVRLSMSTGDIPIKTVRIVNAIGADRLYLYFSPLAYESKFFRFCEKLIMTKHIKSRDYIAHGEIVATRIEVEESTYSG